MQLIVSFYVNGNINTICVLYLLHIYYKIVFGNSPIMIIQTKYLKGSGIANWVSKLYLRKVISLNRFHSTLFDQKKTGCNDWCGRRSYIADVVMEYMFCLQGIPCQGNYQWGKMNTKLGRGLLNNVVLYLIQQHLTKAARAEKWRGKNQTHHTWQT